MAEDVENPRKKQKIDVISAENSDLEDLPSSSTSKEVSSYDAKETEDQNVNCVVDEEKTDDSNTSDTDGPSGLHIDPAHMSGSDSDDSSLSPLSGEDMWRNVSEPMGWVYQMMSNGENPRHILQEILPNEVPDLDEYSLWRLLITIVSEPPPRDKLPNINTLEDVIQLIKTCQNILVLTGAGVSVSCGIPDFRSRNGIYARLAVDFPDLPDPQAMFDIRYFKQDPRPFFKFAKEIYPGKFEPSKCHRFIRLIEEDGKLLRNYTQNIDTLEQVAGIQNVIQCHGSFATATCMTCKYKCSSDEIKQQIYDQVIPRCVKCDPQTEFSIMKPDIVFFGESLPEEFHRQMAADKEKCDLLIVIGSSLKVRPVALIPNSLPAHVPQILINKEHLRALNFDVELLGDCEIIISELCKHLGAKWETLSDNTNPLSEVRVDDLLTPPVTPTELDDNKDKNVIKAQECVKKDKVDSARGQSNVFVDKDKVYEMVDKVKVDVEEVNNWATAEKEARNRDTLDMSKKDHNEGNKKEAVANEKSKNEAVSQSSDQDLKCEGPQEISSDVSGNTVITISRENIDEKNEKDLNEEESKEVAENNIKNNHREAVKNSDGTDKDIDNHQDHGTPNKPDPDLKAMWMPSKLKVSQRLQSHQYCFMPPNRYVFNDAEVFMDIDSDFDDMATLDSDSEKDVSDNLQPDAGDDPKDMEKEGKGDSQEDETTKKVDEIIKLSDNAGNDEETVSKDKPISDSSKVT